MKNLFLSCLTLIYLFIQVDNAFGQYAPACDTPPPAGALTCPETCVYCGDLNGYKGLNDGFLTMIDSSSACPGIQITNPRWYGFVAGSTAISLNIVPTNCQTGTGLQGAIWEACNESPLVCDPGDAASNSLFLSYDSFIPGKTYFLMMDGWAYDVCEFEIVVTNGSMVAPQPSVVQPQGPTLVCAHASYTYSVPNTFGTRDYYWTAPPGASINGLGNTYYSESNENINITFGDSSGQVCVTAENACKSDKKCIDITLHPINIQNILTSGLTGSFKVIGGQSQVNGSNYAAVTMSLQGNPGITATLTTAPFNNNDTVSFTAPQAGTYVVTATDVNGCSGTTTVVVTSGGGGGNNGPGLPAGDCWTWQNPLPQGNDLKDIFFTDSITGWAVGYNTILKTTDGGNTWINQIKNGFGNLNSVFFIDAQTGWVVGDLGAWKSSDGGNTWIEQYSSDPSKPLESFFFINAQTGWIVGRDKILHTVDGGNSWVEQNTGTPVWLYSVYFLDSMTGWATGGGGTLMSTLNGGATWVKQDLGVSELYSVFFINAQIGWVGRNDGTILKTIDGGNTWTAQNAGASFESFRYIYFIDSQKGWAVGRLYAYRTTDGGTTWLHDSQYNGGKSGYFFDSQTGWIVGGAGIILKTTNGGYDWIKKTSAGTYADLKSVSFADNQSGWVVGDGGYILHTSNGGNVWVWQNSSTSEYLYSVYAINPQSACIVGGGGTILRTTDGGNTWKTPTLNLSVGVDHTAVYFVDINLGWTVGQGGEILKTTDGGDTWVDVFYYGHDLYSIYFADNLTGWTVGSNGTILKTNDGGYNWTEQYSTPHSLRSVFFLNTQIGWVVGDGVVLNTTDGGNSWSLSVISSGMLQSINFINDQIGWITERDGSLYNTTDGGANWTYKHLNTDKEIFSGYFADSSTGWVAGADGTILKYNPYLPYCIPTIPLDQQTNVPVTTNITWPASDCIDGYLLSLGTTPGASDLIDNQDLGDVTSYQPLQPLPLGSTIYVRITPYNALGNASGCQEFSFKTADADVTFDIKDTTISAGAFFCTDVIVNNFNQIGTFQFTIAFDTVALKFVSVEATSLLLNGSGVLYSDNVTFSNQGIVTVLWAKFGGATFPDSSIILQLCFQHIGVTTQATTISWTNSPTIGKVTDQNGSDLSFHVLPGLVTIINSTCSPVTTTADTGPGSLREAINCANSNPGPDTIRFNIPGAGPHNIKPLSELPHITEAGTVLDASTQPGWSLGKIVLDGSGLSNPACLTVQGGNGFELYGLVIKNTPANAGLELNDCSNFKIGKPGSGNAVYGNAGSAAQNQAQQVVLQNVTNGYFQSNIIGLTENYTAPGAGSNSTGLAVEGQNIQIGGSKNLNEGNVFGSTYYGTLLWDLTNAFTPANINIWGNTYGTSPAGGNFGGNDGIEISGGYQGVQIGGSADHANIVKNYAEAGVYPYHQFATSQVSISQNQFSCNGAGIGLYFTDPMQSPVITTATTSTVSGTAPVNAQIELYKADTTCLASCQGWDYIGAIQANAGGQWSMPVSLTNGTKITATATLQYTSIFSDCATVCLEPQAVFTSTATGNTLTFSNASTNATTYLWDFGDGMSSTLANPSHTYSSSGVYTVTLSAYNACGTNTATKVINTAPTADFSASPVAGCAPLIVQFTNNSSTNALSYQWQFPGGVPTSSNQANPGAVIYTSPGTYSVTLQATNGQGSDSEIKTSLITVSGLPTASFSHLENGLSTTITNNSSGANSSLWDFGDGNTSTQANPSHTYSAAGTYQVCLTSINTCGNTSTCQSITVSSNGNCNPVSDSLELVKFFEATGGLNWTYHTNWKVPGKGIEEWYGITVEAGGCVTKIELPGNDLVGIIIDLNLPNLKIFNCSYNSLNGNIPDFSNLSNLQLFYCSLNLLNGNIPNFSNLPNLQEFSCYSNSLTGTIPDFSNLQNLQLFDCTSNLLNGNIPDFSNLPNLKRLDCSYNSLTGTIPDFSNLPNLIFFNCSSNPLTGTIPDFSNLPNLQFFYCTSNLLNGNIPDFSNLPNLQGFDCSYNSLNGNIPDFSNLQNLQLFDCSYNSLNGNIPDFSNLPNLKRFACYDNTLTGNIPNFSNLPNIQYFVCGNNSLIINYIELSNTTLLDWISINGNMLTFEDILSSLIDFRNKYNQDLNFYYAPQGLVFHDTTLIINSGQNLNFSLDFDENITTNVYRWSKDGVYQPIQDQTGNNNLVINNISAAHSGVWEVEVTNPLASALTLQSRKITIQVNDCSAVTPPSVSGPTALCGGSAQLAVPSNFAQYAWSSGQSGASITVTQPGLYTVTVTDSNGCTGTDSQNVGGNVPAPVPSISSPTALCAGSATLQTGTFAQYAWSNGLTNASITVTQPDTYTVTVTDSNGCTGTDSQNVGASVPVPAPSISGPTALCAGSATLQTGNFSQYAWSNGQSSASITVTQSNTYTVTVTDSNGCTGADSQNVGASVPLPAPSISGPTALCAGSATLQTGSFEQYAWSNGQSNAGITVTQPDTYTVTVTDSNGCTGTTSQTVANSSAPTAQLLATEFSGSPGDLIVCSGDGATLIAGGGAQYQFWLNDVPQTPGFTTNNTLSIASVTSNLSVTVRIIDNNGCQDSTQTGDGAGREPIQLTVAPLPDLSAFSVQLLPSCPGEAVHILIQAPNLPDANHTVQYKINNGTLQMLFVPFVGGSGDLNLGLLSPQTNAVCQITQIGATTGCVNTPANATLLFNVPSAIQATLDTTICYTQNLVIGGQNYAQQGVYTIHLTTPNNCDSTLTLKLKTVTQYNRAETATICTGKSYDFYGTPLSQQGNYQHTIPGMFGCDTVVQLTLFEHPAVSSFLNKTICPGASFQLGDSTFTTQGFHQVTLTAVSGCDSVVNLNLNIAPISISFPQAEIRICKGEVATLIPVVQGCQNCQYQWNTGATQANLTVKPDASAEYNLSITGANGCSLSAGVQVAVQPIYHLESEMVLCPGDTIREGTLIITKPDTYTLSFSTVSGCDSTILLTVNPFDISALAAEPDTILLPPDGAPTRTFSVTENDFRARDYQIEIVPDLGPKQGTVKVLNKNELIYTLDNPDFFGIDSFQYELCPLLDCPTTCARAWVYVRAQSGTIEEAKKQIPNLITPNGDGFNDNFDPVQVLMDNGILIEESELFMINRWGEIIYHQTQGNGQVNIWDGKQEGRDLPQATYYYRLRVKSVDEYMLKGAVNLLR